MREVHMNKFKDHTKLESELMKNVRAGADLMHMGNIRNRRVNADSDFFDKEKFAARQKNEWEDMEKRRYPSQIGRDENEGRRTTHKITDMIGANDAYSSNGVNTNFLVLLLP